ncbi:MAG TPA: sulfatase [Planctomycetaceae bacterium]|nr:sulfatase [Planctomycetaceae bacterium]
MNSFEQLATIQRRRAFLNSTGVGLGGAVLGNLLGQRGARAADSQPVDSQRVAGTGLDGVPHFPPKAKHVIFLFMAGAPSQLDLFDYKPDLEKKFKEPLPAEVRMGQRVTAMTKGRTHLVQPTVFKFAQQGESGLWMSELLPHLSTVADRLCLIKSMHTDAINHDPGKTLISTGTEIPGKASLGAWLSYGLGSMNRDLPDFMVLNSAFWSGDKRNVQALYSRLWGTGFLPSKHQGVLLQASGDPVLFLSNPPGVDRRSRELMLDMATELNRTHLNQIGDPEIQTTIAQQEMAFRMQASVPELTDLSSETQATLEDYGPEVEKSGSFARNCLLARRMVERGVRFVQLYHRGWDHHADLVPKMRAQCYDVDQPCAALLKDLAQRGLLDETLVVFSGEFGRTVYCQGNQTREKYGRDHHPRCFTAWMAGGGIKGGIAHGQTDEYSYNIVDSFGAPTTRFEDDAVHVRDLNATILHQLGIDHNRLIFPFQGLDQKLTGVEEAHVVNKILA